MRLNEKTIAGLKPPAEGHTITYDESHPGFGFRITAGGVAAFVLDYRMPGENKKHRITVGRFPEMSLKSARDRAKELQVQIRGGMDPLAPPSVPDVATGPTVADLMRDYLGRHVEKHNRPSMVRTTKIAIAHINSRIGTRPVADIEAKELQDLHDGLKATPTQANRVRSTLSKAFALAIEWKYRSDNPVRFVKRNPETPRELYLTREQLDRVGQALGNYPNQATANAIRLMIHTGCRKGEILSARWEDFEDGRWRKPAHHTKQKKIEHVPLGPEALAVLEKMRKESDGTGWLFPGANGNHLLDIKKAWATIRTNAKIKPHPIWGNVRPHDLRHSFAADLASHGESLQVIGRLLGHTQASTTARYAHVSDQALRKALNDRDARLARKVG